MTTSTPALASLPASIRELIARIEAESPLTPAKAKRLLTESSITEADLEPWIDYDHPAEDSYGRKMVWDAGQYELMVMSWAPGDYSAIHDHGYTQWGAVKVFGDAEHAVFDYQGGMLSTQSRVTMPAGSVVAVAHDLIHQMGNVSQPAYPTLHLYGNYERSSEVTADARIFALDEKAIQFTSGGVFFSLPEEKIHRREPGLEADFPTRLRYDVELLRRLGAKRAARPGDSGPDEPEREIRRRLFSAASWSAYRRAVAERVEGEEVQAGPAWDLLTRELWAAADLQASLRGLDGEAAAEERDARLWDETLGPRRLRETVAEYLRFLGERHGLELAGKSVLSAGCRTGLVEAFLLRELGASGEALLGIDPSEPMVRIAAGRLRARRAEPWNLAPEAEARDLVLGSLNALQRSSEGSLEQAVEALAGLTREGGLFVGDFVAPSSRHRRARVDLESEDALLIEQSIGRANGAPARRHEALRLRLDGDEIRLETRGERIDCSHGRREVESLFARHFGGEVRLFDASDLAALDRGLGARYLVMARKGS